MKLYWPVSLLSIVFKAMERIFNTCTSKCYEQPGEERLVSADQFGLRPGLSSANLQTSLYPTWLEA